MFFNKIVESDLEYKRALNLTDLFPVDIVTSKTYKKTSSRFDFVVLILSRNDFSLKNPDNI